MNELAALMNMRGSLGLHVIDNPNGTYSFVGHVPMVLAYEGPAEDIEIGRKHGFGLVRNKVRKLVWPTAEAAWQAAKNAGYARCPSADCSCNS